MAAEIIFFPQTGYGRMVLTNSEVIWDMSGKTFSCLLVLFVPILSESFPKNVQETTNGQVAVQ
jgi:hypothetical protein